ncbi:MAG: SoxR reducing system RseC family protein [Fibrobacter sp.]|jgi:positive regulator of sigma E activity|nr:SoxR reducing system RseC family protein [Fibrobacter sp.]
MILIRQEIKDGVVVDYKKKQIWIVLDQKCRSEGKCHAGCGGCGEAKPSLKKRVFLKKSMPLEKGQKITLKMHILNENIAALLVFGIPVLMALSCALMWYLYSPQDIESPLALLTTAFAFVSGFLLVWIIDTIFSMLFPPTIILPTPVQELVT